MQTIHRDIEVVLELYNTNKETGLTDVQVASARNTHGQNVFAEAPRFTLWNALVEQFRSPLVIILIIAGVITVWLNHLIDAGVIALAITVNIVIGLIQEGRASRAFDKLVASQVKTTTVIRDGSEHVVESRELVPGDIVVVAPGNSVPADIRLITSENISTNEASLTGESLPVDKHTGSVSVDTPISEQTNMLFMGTFVASGRGTGVVVATGGATQIGEIADGLSNVDQVLTPIQKSVRNLARFLAIVIVCIVIIIFVLGLLRGEPLNEMFLIAVAVAVSVIPGGLPAAVAAVLAIGMERILDRGGLVRNLLAAETLGSTTIIFTDKTGTLTESDIKVVHIDTHASREMVVASAIRAGDAFREEDGSFVGHPIERAILSYADDLAITRNKNDREGFLPFDPDNRFTAGLYGDTHYIAGVPELLIDQASYYYLGDAIQPMTDEVRNELLEILNSSRDLRFIGVSQRSTAENVSYGNPETVIAGSVFLGLVGLTDPLRADVPAAIATAREAGARIIMITGDNRETAIGLAKQAGIADAHHQDVLMGADIEMLDDNALRARLEHVSICARMLPKHKLRLVRVMQADGHIVAMTGDGVNDAPALQRADIGVAVGSGTEIAQEAADLVLIEDSFSVIVAAIEEGRRIIDNLKKVVTHLVATSFGEVFVIAGSIIVGLPLPILAIQILWLNIVEEGLLNFAFAFEEKEEGIMKRDPNQAQNREILTGAVQKLIIGAGVATGLLVFGLYLFLHHIQVPIEEIRTIIFVALSLDAILFAFSIKNFHTPFWNINPFTNRYLVIALLVNAGILVLSVTFGPLRDILQLVPLSIIGLEVLLFVAICDLAIMEIAKRLVYPPRATMSA